jgi:uncharacterized protein (TIGR03435 family)
MQSFYAAGQKLWNFPPAPLELRRMTLPFMNFRVAVLLAASAACYAADGPSFEVASVKAAPPITMEGAKSGRILPVMNVDQARVEIRNLSLADLVSRAYRVKSYQVIGPDWISSERYEIRATIPQGVSPDQVPEMLQALLATRFKLVLHRDRKDMPVYALIAGKNGLKVAEATPDPPSDSTGAAGAKPEAAFIVSRDNLGNTSSTSQAVKFNSDGTFHIDRKMTMAALANFLSGFVDRPVVDMTETTATYQIALDVSIAAKIASGRATVRVAGADGGPVDPGAAREALDRLADSSGGSIFASVQKLGLKLDARKAPMETLVVEHAEKIPTEN